MGLVVTAVSAVLPLYARSMMPIAFLAILTRFKDPTQALSTVLFVSKEPPGAARGFFAFFALHRAPQNSSAPPGSPRVPRAAKCVTTHF